MDSLPLCNQSAWKPEARTSKAVTSLLDKQMITRSPGPGNRRQALISLTERGVALHGGMLPQVLAINAPTLSVLPRDAVAQRDQSLSQRQQHAKRRDLADSLPRTGRHLGRGRRPVVQPQTCDGENRAITSRASPG